MAEPKVVTVIITVDLKCSYRAAKIKCTICQLQMSFKINSINFDEKNSTVTVSGPFDPYFICYLRCMAGDVIKDVVIKGDSQSSCGSCPPIPGPCWRCSYQICYKVVCECGPYYSCSCSCKK